MNVKKCEECGLKWDEDVAPHVCPTKPKEVKSKTKKGKGDEEK
ncbi:MAG: hypothetical protein ABIG61_12430 [Planctomycetota bacterium]